jgi:hypothetical protein
VLLFRRLWLVCLIWKRDITVKSYETVKVDVTVKQKSPKQLPWRNGAKYSESGTKSDNFTVNYLYNNPWQMIYSLFEIVLINLCNKYYLFKLKYVWCISLVLLPFIIVAQHESGTRKTISWSVTVDNKHLTSQCFLTAPTEQVEDKNR